MISARNAFRKSDRLLTSADFRHVFQRARKRSAGGLTLYVRGNDLGYSRLGIAISRKCSPRAVVRNRIKRVIRESFRLRKPKLGAVDLVFLGQPGMARSRLPELRGAVDKLLIEIEQCATP